MRLLTTPAAKVGSKDSGSSRATAGLGALRFATLASLAAFLAAGSDAECGGRPRLRCCIMDRSTISSRLDSIDHWSDDARTSATPPPPSGALSPPVSVAQPAELRLASLGAPRRRKRRSDGSMYKCSLGSVDFSDVASA